jgi:hypothetical protein
MPENFAERLFVDLKNNNIEIEKPKFWMDGCKIGSVPNTKQLVLFGMNDKYCYGQGPGIPVDDVPYVFKYTFTEAYNNFLEAVNDCGPVIRFHSLIIPRKGVIEVKLEEFETVISRFIIDYLPMCDDKLERWDVMVEKVNSND